MLLQMVKRKRVGIFYTYNETWIGGTYYIENLISALNKLEDAELPFIVLITNNRKDRLVARKKIKYPYLSFQRGSGERYALFQMLNKICNRLINIKPFDQKIRGLDAVFPYYKCIQQSLAKKKIYWIADFQEHFYPEFFSPESIDARRTSQAEIQSSEEELVLSSNDALQHFRMLYPGHTVKISLLPFAVTHPDYSHLDIEALKTKFDLSAPYFICPNQFWQHKNQLIVLQAIKLLLEQGFFITVVFTGNFRDDRNPEYFDTLMRFINDFKLGERIRLLGFIDRRELLQLMAHSIAVIQPSLFEGWSTVVEDSKAMNKSLVASGIDVHREQLNGSKAVFFDPVDPGALADKLKNVLTRNGVGDLYDNPGYEGDVLQFAHNFLKITR